RFSAFLSELQHLNATISRIDREINRGRPGNYFRVAELSYSSPARVVLEPHPIGREQPTAHLIIDRLDNIRRALANGGELDEIDSELLEDIRNLARPVGRQLRSATLLFNSSELNLNAAVASRVESALAVEEECFGSFEGMLEQINIHAEANVFHIYPGIGP